MGGLLAGLGQGLAKGIEAGTKVYTEGTLEQMKQEAAERREMNMLRIQEMFAAGRQTSAQAHTEKMAGERVTHELGMAKTEAELKLGMAETERNFRTGLQKDTNELAVQLEREKDADARARIALQHNYAVKLQALMDKKPKETMQRYLDIVEILGGDKEKAKELTLYSLSGKKEEKALYAATMKGFIRNAEAGGIPISKELLADWKKISQEVSGLTESDFAGKPTGPGESAFARAKREAAEKAAAGNPNVENPAPVETSGQQGTAYTFGGVGETGVPPGYSPREWNKMSPAEQDQARKDYVAKRKAQHKGLLTEKE